MKRFITQLASVLLIILSSILFVPSSANAAPLMPLDPTAILGVAVKKMYWTQEQFDNSPPKIRRANLDGTNAEDVVVYDTESGSPTGIALDFENAKIYWSDQLFDNIEHSTC